MDKITFYVSNLSTSYDKFKISGVSFQLNQGDIMGLVGRSGSGKSTIVNTLVGLKRMDSGNVGVKINGSNVLLKNLIGYSPQGNSLYPFLTLEENLLTFGRLYKIRKKDMKERIGFLLKKLDLQNSRKKRIVELSGGMQKRADLAVTLIHDPRIIILDEPFTGLDISLQRFIWEFLKELSSEGKIIIISSHLLGDIQKNCNQFGLVYDGGFYGTEQLIRSIKDSKENSLEVYLEKLFTKGLVG